MRKYFLLLSIPVLFSLCTKEYGDPYTDLSIGGLPDTVSIVATGDLYGSKKAELVFGQDSVLSIYQIKEDTARSLYTISFPDDILLMTVGDVDNDQKNELVVVSGRRRYVETDVRVDVVEFADDQWVSMEIYSKFSTRPLAVGLIIADNDNDDINEIVVSYFESKYMVETVALSFQIEDWESEMVSQERMAMTRDIGKLPDFDINQMVVGRVYGDEIGMTGDSYISGQEKVMLPTFRGVKVVKIGDGDNDGVPEIFVGDGWHQDYGKIARGRFAWIEYKDDEYHYELIEDVKYQYDMTQIEIEDITGKGRNDVLTRGNAFFSIYRHTETGWTVFCDTAIKPRQFAVGDVVGNKQNEVILSGPQVRILSFGQLEFSTELGEEIATEKVYPDSLIGQRAPELSVRAWYNGRFEGLYNSKGKVIMLDFWATWCAPCIKTFPHLKAMQEKYGDRGFQLLGFTRIDNRQTIADIEAFIIKENFVYPIGLSEESLNNLAYGVGAIPHVVLIDKKGVVRYFRVGSGNEEALANEVEKLLNE